jgi:hypothetical protein
MMAWALASALMGGVGAVEIGWDTGRLVLNEQGRLVALVDTASGRNYALPGHAFCRLQTAEGTLAPTLVRRSGSHVRFDFPGGISVTYRVTSGAGFSRWEVEGIGGTEVGKIQTVTLCRVRVDGLRTVGGAINASYDERYAIAVMATHLNVLGYPQRAQPVGGSSEGVSYSFQPETKRVKQGRQAVVFAATSKREDSTGWAMRGRSFADPLDLRGLRATKAWVYGDGKGELLKIQLADGKGGYLDSYIKIDFTGWREVTCEAPAAQQLDLGHVSQLNLYYNGLPAQGSVECVVDSVRAVVGSEEGEREVMLADFEEAELGEWEGRGVWLQAESYARHGVLPAGFGLIACPRRQFEATVDRFEQAAGLPNPHPGGVWSHLSPWTKRSYLFITGFREADADEVIKWARRGGFHMILIGGDWSASHGHHEVNREHFPDGLPSLQRAVGKLRQAGLHVGLHFLAAAVYLNDAYVWPKPDPRLFKDAWAELAAEVDERADFIPTAGPPQGFPAEDGGYEGNGTFIQIGDELIHYGELRMEPPYGFAHCQRGACRTVAAAHQRGEKIAHVLRSYGYFLYDLDSTLAEEVIGNVCRVANAINADMLYFDGSERLQGDHWYYNAKLQSMYYERLRNKDALLQGSSYSHYSWHLISRMASADGSGDIKRYLDERIPWFHSYADNLMPLDIGWYYVYDPEVTADQFEYVLQKCLGFGASISVQTNPQRLRDHPEMGAIFDLVRTYEQLRLAGKVPESTRAVLREPGREYRLLRAPLRLRRVAYGPWQAVTGLDGQHNSWQVEPAVEGARLGMQVRCGPLSRPGPAYRSPRAVTLESFDDLAPYLQDPSKRFDVFVIGPGKAGSVSPGVSQELASVEEGAVEGRRCGRYTATNSLATAGGWSAIGKRFDPPLDLSWHKAIGLWLRGDGHGGAFKLQLRDQRYATDYYILNNFTEWRYLQLLRPTAPQPEPIDYSRVEYLIFYYNGLPARTTVTCWIDDVKALAEVDEAQVVEPELEVRAGAERRRLVFPVSLRTGERLVYFPGERPYVIPATAAGERRFLEAPVSEPLALTGPVTITFRAKEPLTGLAKVRWVQEGQEEIALPEPEARRGKGQKR